MKPKRRVVYLKEKGTLTNRTRTLCRKLSGCGVPADEVKEAIHAVCTAFRVDIVENIGPQNIGPQNIGPQNIGPQTVLRVATERDCGSPTDRRRNDPGWR